MLRSIDGGVTWAQAAPPLNAGLIGAFYASGNRLYAGFGDDLFGNPTPDQTGLFWSGDHGGNWQLFPELYGLVINSVVQIGYPYRGWRQHPERRSCRLVSQPRQRRNLASDPAADQQRPI